MVKKVSSTTQSLWPFRWSSSRVVFVCYREFYLYLLGKFFLIDIFNQMHKNYKINVQVITNIIYRRIKPTEPQKQIKFIIYYSKFKKSNLIVKKRTNSPKTLLNQTNVAYKFTCQFRECLSENNITANAYINHTTTTLSRRLTHQFSYVKQHLMTKHNKVTDKLISPDIRKILNTKTIYKNSN